jgi:hypothetical protein
MTTATKKEKKRRSLPLEAGSSSGHTTNLKQFILETFDIYGSLTFIVFFNQADYHFKKINKISQPKKQNYNFMTACTLY